MASLKLLSIIALFFFASFVRCDSPSSACDFCTMSVAGLESYAVKPNTGSEIIEHLKSLCKALKDIDEDIEQQCLDFVDVYGSYVLDTYEKQSNPATVCETLGFCSATTADEYEILFPVVYEKNITYEITTITPRTSWRYKFFTGNSTDFFGSADVPSMMLRLSEFKGEIKMSVTLNGTKRHVQCHEGGDCVFWMNAVSGSWYYVDLDAEESTTIRFNATEIVLEAFRWGSGAIRVHFSLVPFLLLISTVGAILCLCMSCCLRLRHGRLNRQRKCQKNAEQPQVENVAIPMEMMAVQPEMEDQLVGYYYYPDQGLYMPAYLDPSQSYPEPHAPEFEH